MPDSRLCPRKIKDAISSVPKRQLEVGDGHVAYEDELRGSRQFLTKRSLPS